jgi:hypothetical protein
MSLMVALALGVVPLFFPRVPLRQITSQPSTLPVWDKEPYLNAVADERLFYFSSTGLRGLLARPPPSSSFRRRGEGLKASGHVLSISSAVGIAGFIAGPETHMLDDLAVCDALLSRLPSKAEPFRPGHAHRAVPLEYVTGNLCGPEAVHDPILREWFLPIWRVTRDPVLEPARLHDLPFFVGATASTFRDLHGVPTGPRTVSDTYIREDSLGHREVTVRAGLGILACAPRSLSNVSFTAAAGDYCIMLSQDGKVMAQVRVPSTQPTPTGREHHTVRLDTPTMVDLVEIIQQQPATAQCSPPDRPADVTITDIELSE